MQTYMFWWLCFLISLIISLLRGEKDTLSKNLSPLKDRFYCGLPLPTIYTLSLHPGQAPLFWRAALVLLAAASHTIKQSPKFWTTKFGKRAVKGF